MRNMLYISHTHILNNIHISMYYGVALLIRFKFFRANQNIESLDKLVKNGLIILIV
jgi:hypothetical protein